MEDLRFPIGRYAPRPYDEDTKKKWLNDLRFLPTDVEHAIANLDEHQLDTPYRDGGWTVRQVVHHLADSHMNALTRFKLGLTESSPTIKPYDEAAWALLRDVTAVPINVSITLLHALHLRWVACLQELTSDQWNKTVFHPEHQQEMTLWYLLGNYAWHGRHHVAHITSLRERNNW